MDNTEQALVPITEAIPELRADAYANVREWDAARMALEGNYEAADGEYLKKIRDELQRANGQRTPLWKAYLDFRGVPYQTALHRIQKVEGHIVTPRDNANLVLSPEPESSAFRPATALANTNWQEPHAYDNEPPVSAMWAEAYDDEPPQEAEELVNRFDHSKPAYCKYCYTTHNNWMLVEPGVWECQKCDHRTADEFMQIEGVGPSEEQKAFYNRHTDLFNQPSTPAPVSEPAPTEVDAVPSVTTFSVEAWEELHQDLRRSIIEEGREGRAGLNQQKSDSIEWAQWSWNPVTGCLHECPYCYARDIANRFYPQGFKPTFHPFRLGAPSHQAVPTLAETELGYRNIFTCSMADLFGKWVPAEWIEAVLDVARDNPQWNFLFLTKFPNRLAEFSYPTNAWLGTSVDCQARVKNAERAFAKVQGGIKWLSIEPMLEPIRFSSLDMFDWVVIGGASSSSQTPAWIPPRRWVIDLERQAADAGCMIYEKTNLFALSPASDANKELAAQLRAIAPFRLREYPGWKRPEPTLPQALKYLPSIG